MSSASLAPSAAKSFVVGGNATFTIVSKVSGARKTFKVEAAPEKPGMRQGFFVKLLTGPNNEADYRYLGIAFESNNGMGFALNKQGWNKPAADAFRWMVDTLNRNPTKFAEQAEFWHEGCCCVCGRKLTTPESIANGIGPVCAAKD